jgi:hypothetical protein
MTPSRDRSCPAAFTSRARAAASSSVPATSGQIGRRARRYALLFVAVMRTGVIDGGGAERPRLGASVRRPSHATFRAQRDGGCVRRSTWPTVRKPPSVPGIRPAPPQHRPTTSRPPGAAAPVRDARPSGAPPARSAPVVGPPTLAEEPNRGTVRLETFVQVIERAKVVGFAAALERIWSASGPRSSDPASSVMTRPTPRRCPARRCQPASSRCRRHPG